MNTSVKGEYKTVGHKSKEKGLLIAAHRTPITQRGAEELVGALQRLFGVSPIRIRWRKRSNGKAAPSANTITLPSQTANSQELAKHPWGLLRVGIVLHEFTHMLPHAGRDHGQDFIRAYDLVLRTTRDKVEGTLFHASTLFAPCEQTIQAKDALEGENE